MTLKDLRKFLFQNYYRPKDFTEKDSYYTLKK